IIEGVCSMRCVLPASSTRISFSSSGFGVVPAREYSRLHLAITSNRHQRRPVMSQRDVIWNSAKFIGTISVIAATVIPASAQQRPTSPVAAAPAENRYPDGSKLQSQYSSAPRSVVLPSAAASVRANSAGFASAAAVQTDLPEGFSLLAAPTSHVGGTDQPVGANTATATAADRVASSTEKFITVFPLAYRGVPLSKGSDYLTIVDGNGQIQATRKRAMP